jgi:hypothetical protein
MITNCDMSAKFRGIVEKNEILVFEGFDIIYECVRSTVREWCDMIVIHRK